MPNAGRRDGSMDQKTQLYERLREKGQRITPQKRAILDILLDNPGRMLSVSEICARLPKGDRKSVV